METPDNRISRRLPLLHDGHTHPLLYAALIDSVDLDRVPGGAEEALTALQDSAGNRPTGWTIGHGWDPIRQPLTQSDVDAIDQPFRMLLDRVGFRPGIDLFLGSDGMPHGVEAALQAALFPPLASQRLTLDEFVAGYCLPDLTHGWIDVEIDGKASRCTCRPHLTAP